MTHTPPILKGVCPDRLPGFDKLAIEDVLGRLAPSVGKLPLQAVVSWGGQTGQTRRANIELRDCLVRGVTGSFLALVWISDVAGGAPGGSQVVTVADGTLVNDLGAAWLVQTNAKGQIALDVEGLAGDRWVSVVPLGGVYGAMEVWA